MQLDMILNNYKICREYNIDTEVSEYLYYIDSEPFYVEPTFSDVQTDRQVSTLNPKFILFSAPGATGKSQLARHIAHKYKALYWDTSKIKLGTNSFVGTISQGVGAMNYSSFMNDMCTAKSLLVIDSLDEAEIVSGRKMIGNLLLDICKGLPTVQVAPVFLFSRTETAQFIASFCAQNSIPLIHYEIGFFHQEASINFILRSIAPTGQAATPAQRSCAVEYYTAISNTILDKDKESFLGYAPVLQAIAKHMSVNPNMPKLISELKANPDCTSIILNIMKALLDRERNEKVIPALEKRCKEQDIDFRDYSLLYSDEEQLVRIVWYILFGDTKYDNYPLDNLPPRLIDVYQETLDINLPQHPFVRSIIKGRTSDTRSHGFTGPAFQDYTLARLLLSSKSSDIVKLYFDVIAEDVYSISQIFFECYTKLANNQISASHLPYLYSSFRAKSTAFETPYLQCSELTSDEKTEYDILLGSVNLKKSGSSHFTTLSMNVDNPVLMFDHAINMSIDTPSLDVILGRNGDDSCRIANSSIICSSLTFCTRNILIESYAPEGCLLVSKEPIRSDSPIIDVVSGQNLHVSAPNLNSFHRLIEYRYDLEDQSSIDKTKFIHALRCILSEFRTHKKDALAKTAERINFVTVGKSQIKQVVLNYLKDSMIIYSDGHLYKVNQDRMGAIGINFTALARMNEEQLDLVFTSFCTWLAENERQN